MKTKTRSKIWAILGTIVMVLPLLLGLGSVKTSATEGDPVVDENNVTVNLHKLKLPVSIAGQDNDGSTYPFDQQYESLNGVEFTVYDVTADYWAKMKKTDENPNPSSEDVVAKLAATDYDVSTLVSVGAKSTEGDGLASFSLPKIVDVDGVKRNAVYLFVETKKGDNESNIETSQNLVVMLPFYNDEKTAELGTVDLYPKNIWKNTVIDIKKVDSSKALLLDGAEFTVTNAKGEFYTGVDATTGFATFDAAETSLTTKDGIISLHGLKDGKYTLTEKTGPSNYESLVGIKSPIVFEIKDFKLVDGDISYDIDKTFDLGIPEGYVSDAENDGKLPENVGVITVENLQDFGSYQFVKQDADTKEKLAGAEFNVLKSNDEKSAVLWEKISDDGVGYKYAWSDDEGVTDANYQPVILKSDVNGLVELNNVKQGKYYLKEVTAPTGYVLPSNPITPFEVKEDLATDPTQILNQTKGILPHTGGMGIVLFVVVGAALVGGVAFYFIKRRQETEA